MEQEEEELLELTKSWMGRVPVRNLDILVVDEIGKVFFGSRNGHQRLSTGGVNGEYNPWPNTPKIERIFVRGISNRSYGNGVGLGMADVIHDRLLEQIDWNPTRINSLTASTPAAIRTPAHFASDRECLERFMPTVGRLDLSQVTYGWIPNSLEIGLLALSENLKSEIDSTPYLEILSGPWEFEFDSKGDLPAMHDMAARLGVTNAADVAYTSHH